MAANFHCGELVKIFATVQSAFCVFFRHAKIQVFSLDHNSSLSPKKRTFIQVKAIISLNLVVGRLRCRQTGHNMATLRENLRISPSILLSAQNNCCRYWSDPPYVFTVSPRPLMHPPNHSPYLSEKDHLNSVTPKKEILRESTLRIVIT